MAKKKPPVETLSKEELLALVREQQRKIAELLKENERLKRAQHRQATPFSKERPVKNPKKPGRKKGQGPFRRRQAPAQKPSVTMDAEAPPNCRFCGGPLEQEGEEYGVGIPVGRVPGVLQELTGVTITQSALTPDALRRAKGEVGAEYRKLPTAVQEAPFVHTDDTGWKVGGKTAFLMGFDTDRETVYQIRPQHRNEEVRELIPGDYAGVMITDRGKSYDAEEVKAVEQQKCLGHILRNIADVVETKQGRAREFGVHAKVLLQDGMELWRAREDLTADVFAEKAGELKELVSYHLRDRTLTDADNSACWTDSGYTTIGAI